MRAPTTTVRLAARLLRIRRITEFTFIPRRFRIMIMVDDRIHDFVGLYIVVRRLYTAF